MPIMAEITQKEMMYPMCFIGTRPMTIIIKTTASINAAVEKFSGKISAMSGSDVPRIYLVALGCAPSDVCNCERMCAVASTIVPFAISDGCSGIIPNNFIQRAASFSFVPIKYTRISNTREKGTMIGVASLKYRQGTFSTPIILTTPTRRMIV
jgi:hypothetical protein